MLNLNTSEKGLLLDVITAFEKARQSEMIAELEKYKIIFYMFKHSIKQ